jgi:uncharacterized membrane protein YgcG
MAHYPNVLKWMDDNLSWTTQLGQAFVNQQQDVMDSVQRLRTSAYNLGNLPSTPQQQVVSDDGSIEILPVDPEVVYLPTYQPDEVYYQGGFGVTFGDPFPIGIWLNCDFDWHHRHLIIWDHSHPRPHNWWHERPGDRDRSIGGRPIWHPSPRAGRPVANRGDRGWNNNPVRSTGPARNQPAPRPHDVPPIKNQPRIDLPSNNHRPEPVTGSHPAPAPAPHNEPIVRPPNTGALIGIGSSHDTRDFSDRGHQSMGTVTHSGSAPAIGGGNNNGGGHAPSGGGGGLGGGGGGGRSGGGGGGGGGRR